MQGGSSQTAIVQSLEGLGPYRDHNVTAMKKAAHRRHRNRVRQELRMVSRGVIDADEFDGQAAKSEVLDAWDIY